jgi:hypothetical protein
MSEQTASNRPQTAETDTLRSVPQATLTDGQAAAANVQPSPPGQSAAAAQPAGVTTPQTDNATAAASPAADEPSAGAIQKYLLYTLSIPERALRSGVGLVGGMAKEASSLLIPQAFRDSKTYQIMVSQMLDFLVEDVGGVAGCKATDSPEAAQAKKIENFVARKTVGNFVETASLLTFHISPMTALAILSDVAYGSNAFLRELSQELKKQGLINEKSTINHVDDLLDAVAAASGSTAMALDTPPLSVDGLRETVEQARDAVRRIDPKKLIPQTEMQRMWDEMSEIARREDVGLLQVSGAMTMHMLNKVAGVGRGVLSGVTVAGNLFERHILSYYSAALTDLKEKGFYATLAEISGPYIEAVWNNFSANRATVTEEVVTGRFFAKAWRWLRGCLVRKNTQQEDAGPAEPPSEQAAG